MMAGEGVWRRPAPVWLKIIAGVVVFPALWGLIAVLLGRALGVPANWTLIAAALAGAVASLFLARKSSLPAAGALIVLPLLAYVFTYYGIQLQQQEPSEPSGGAPSYKMQVPTEPEAQAPAPEQQALPTPSPEPVPPAASGDGSQPGTQGEMTAPEPEAVPPAQMEQQGASEGAGPSPAELEQQAAELAAERAKEEAERRAEEEAGAKAAPPAADGSEIIVGGQGHEQLPEFPWPPPQASASYVLPDRLLADYHTVGEVAGAILNALEQSGYVERSFFQTKAGGVALVTRLERINDDGTPSPAAERWPNTGQYSASREGLLQFLEGLFYVDPGHYRVIVFVLQDMPFSQSSTNVTAKEARAWLTSGANVLPPDIAARPFGGANGGHCTALIYEFASDGTNVRVVESQLTGKEHLEKAGLLATLGTAH
jgi:hypothetical protein